MTDFGHTIAGIVPKLEAELAEARRERDEARAAIQDAQGERESALWALVELAGAARKYVNNRQSWQFADLRTKLQKAEAELQSQRTDGGRPGLVDGLRAQLAEAQRDRDAALALAGTVDPAGALESAHAELREAAATIGALRGQLSQERLYVDAVRSMDGAFREAVYSAIRARDAELANAYELGWHAIVERDEALAVLREEFAIECFGGSSR